MWINRDNLPLLIFSNLNSINGLKHFVTTRAGGFSAVPYHSLNLGMHVNDNRQHVVLNREYVAKSLNIDSGCMLFATQVHSGDVTVINKQAIAEGIMLSAPETDATITNLPGICLMVMVADCVPVLLYDPVTKVAAAVHAGWRGTVKQITTNTIRTMISVFGCKAADIIVGIGPSIGPCCYEVGPDVVATAEKNLASSDGLFVYNPNNHKPHFDLWYANSKQAKTEGVLAKNIETSGICTCCHSDTFFSSRASGGITGRFAAGIMIL